MKTPNPQCLTRNQAFTLLEMTLVIGVLLALVAASTFFANGLSDWRRGKLANEALTELNSLNLGYNQIGDEGAAAIASLPSARPFCQIGVTLESVNSRHQTELLLPPRWLVK